MRRVGTLVAAAGVGIALAVTLSARTAASGEQAAFPFKSATSLVALNVTVQDAKSRYVAGLQAADFAVFENGVRQDVRFFESRSMPLDLVLLLDTSTSMSQERETVRRAARGLLDTLRAGDRGAVVSFDDRVTVRQGLTPDRSALLAAVDGLKGRGNTALHAALYVALKHFGAAVTSEGAVRRQAIVVLSDGEDTASLLSFDDVLGIARQTGVNVYTVRLKARNELDWRADMLLPKALTEADYEMKTLARETGALSFFPRIEDLQGVYAAIAEELACQYSIGYEPVNARGDGGFRRVAVKIVNRLELRARTRAGYVPEAVRASGPK